MRNCRRHLALALLLTLSRGDVLFSHSALPAANRANAGPLHEVMTAEKAREIFKSLKDEKYFSRAKPDGGCHPRADVACYLLETKHGFYSRKVEISCGKDAYLVPRAEWNEKREIRWPNHVAPVVSVRQEGRTEEWVFDVLFDRPLPLAEWKKRLNIPGGEPKPRRTEEAGKPFPDGACLVFRLERFQNLTAGGRQAREWDLDDIKEQEKKLLK